MIEEWRQVVGSEGDYEVSNLGRVRSVDRVHRYVRRDQYSGRDLEIFRSHRGRILRPAAGSSGHLSIVLGRVSAGGRGSCAVHRLVLEAFAGPCPPGCESLHGDAGVADNSITNLRWGTRSENVLDDIRRGVRDKQYGWEASP